MATLIPDQAKRPITRAAGPYGHPFHPILVSIPIGAWVAGSHSLADVARYGVRLVDEATQAEGFNRP